MILKIVKYFHKMNTLEYYNRQKEAWDDKEIEDVKTEYEEKEMTISQIGDIHYRTPGSISCKLKFLGIIAHNTLARGYLDYKNSNLYKEIVEISKIADIEKKVKKVKKEEKEEKLKIIKEEEKKKLKISISPVNAIIKMQNEIADLKKDVKEMLRLMNALYDFENQ